MTNEKIQLTLPKTQKKRAPYMVWGVALLVLAAAAGGTFVWWNGKIVDEAARVESGILPLTAGISGRVEAVPVQLNETVQPGQVLIKLDSAQLQARVDESRARLDAMVPGAASTASARAAEQSLLANMEQTRELERRAVLDVEHFAAVHAQAQFELRHPALQKAGEKTRNAAQLKEIEARTALESARAAQRAQSRVRAAADSDLQRFRTDITLLARSNVDEQTLGQVQEILASRLHEAEAQLHASTLAAPQEGRIARLAVQPGDFVHAGQVLAELEPVRVRILARLEPAEARRLTIGQSATVRFVDQPQVPAVSATIREILLPDSNGRVPVRVVLDDPLPEAPARDAQTQVKFFSFPF